MHKIVTSPILWEEIQSYGSRSYTFLYSSAVSHLEMDNVTSWGRVCVCGGGGMVFLFVFGFVLFCCWKIMCLPWSRVKTMKEPQLHSPPCSAVSLSPLGLSLSHVIGQQTNRQVFRRLGHWSVYSFLLLLPQLSFYILLYRLIIICSWHYMHALHILCIFSLA